MLWFVLLLPACLPHAVAVCWALKGRQRQTQNGESDDQQASQGAGCAGCVIATGSSGTGYTAGEDQGSGGWEAASERWANGTAVVVVAAVVAAVVVAVAVAGTVDSPGSRWLE
jgi:hypothetical protein